MFFYKHNAYKHMKAQIRFKVFCFLMNKLVLEKNKYTINILNIPTEDIDFLDV